MCGASARMAEARAGSACRGRRQGSPYYGIEVGIAANARRRFKGELGDVRRSEFCTEMAHPARFELTTSAFGGQRSIQLSYGCPFAGPRARRRAKLAQGRGGWQTASRGGGGGAGKARAAEEVGGVAVGARGKRRAVRLDPARDVADDDGAVEVARQHVIAIGVPGDAPAVAGGGGQALDHHPR